MDALLKLLALGATTLGLGLLIHAGLRAAQDRASLRASETQLVARHGLISPVTKRLAEDYQDRDANLIADLPEDASSQLDPERLVVAYYEGDDDDSERVDWPAFQKQLEAITGKPVAGQPYVNSADEIAAVRAGEIHVIALHAADVPYLVNNAGFVPIAVLGTGDGASGNHLVLATGRQAGLRSLRDLRGLSLTCTRPDSITGYRAAIAVLARDAGLRPGADYRVDFSFGQKRSIQGLIDGEYQVAAVSADKLQSMIAAEEIQPGDLKIVFESQVIPRLAVGYIHRLRPELAEKIRACALEFENAGADSETGGKPMRFQAIDYVRDFEFVRTIDDSFDPRFGKIASGR